MPRVFNIKTATVDLSHARYIGRPGKWGNPFIINEWNGKLGRHMTRDDVITEHRYWLLNTEEGKRLLAQIHELRGCDLKCFCVPEACHGDTLIELANDPIT